MRVKPIPSPSPDPQPHNANPESSWRRVANVSFPSAAGFSIRNLGRAAPRLTKLLHFVDGGLIAGCDGHHTTRAVHGSRFPDATDRPVASGRGAALSNPH